MITLGEDFGQRNVRSRARGNDVAGQEDYGQAGLLRMTLPGYASEYNMNTDDRHALEKRLRATAGART